MQLRIPMAQFKIFVRNVWSTHWYRQNQIHFAIVFQDLHSAAPKCRIESSTDTPLTGANLVYTAETI